MCAFVCVHYRRSFNPFSIEPPPLYTISPPSLPPSPLPDNTTGNISRNPTEQIDRESMAQYNLVVEARDGGDPQMNATALVRIDILVRM